MHRITGLDDGDNLLGITVNQGDLSRISQRHGEDILDVVLVLLFGGTFLRRHQQLPGRLHLFHAEFRRDRWFMLQVLGHQRYFIRAEVTRGAPVGHTRR